MENHIFNFINAHYLFDNSDDIDTIAQEMPENSVALFWVNDSSTFGSEIRGQIKENVYGYLFVVRPNYEGDGGVRTVYFILVSYTLTGIYLRSHTNINNTGWSPYWKKITMTNIGVE